jgi:hypothetical protein
MNAIQSIMKEHKAAYLAALSRFCENCGSPTANVLQTPMSWLHKAEDPFVTIWVNATCGKGECEIQIRQQVQDVILYLQLYVKTGAEEPREILIEFDIRCRGVISLLILR